MEKEFKDYLDSSVFLLRQINQMLRNHNKMFAVSAANGDVASSGALLSNNIALASIETLLGYEIVSRASTPGEEEVTSDSDVKQAN